MIKVTKPFKGVRDGETRTRLLEEGEELTGKLAKVAIAQGWAEEVEDTADASSDQSGGEGGSIGPGATVPATGGDGPKANTAPANTAAKARKSPAKNTSRKAAAKKKS